jgi:hypothetical protein
MRPNATVLPFSNTRRASIWSSRRAGTFTQILKIIGIVSVISAVVLMTTLTVWGSFSFTSTSGSASASSAKTSRSGSLADSASVGDVVTSVTGPDSSNSGGVSNNANANNNNNNNNKGSGEKKLVRRSRGLEEKVLFNPQRRVSDVANSMNKFMNLGGKEGKLNTGSKPVHDHLKSADVSNRHHSSEVQHGHAGNTVEFHVLHHNLIKDQGEGQKKDASNTQNVKRNMDSDGSGVLFPICNTDLEIGGTYSIRFVTGWERRWGNVQVDLYSLAVSTSTFLQKHRSFLMYGKLLCV